MFVQAKEKKKMKAAADNDYVPTYKSFNAVMKPGKTLFMSPIYVKREPPPPPPPAAAAAAAAARQTQNGWRGIGPSVHMPSANKLTPFTKDNLPLLHGNSMSINRETSTQTSKTIIELAKLDQMVDDRFSVDSLCMEQPEKEQRTARTLKEMQELTLTNWMDHMRRETPTRNAGYAATTSKSKFSFNASEASLLQPAQSRRITSFHTLINLRGNAPDDTTSKHDVLATKTQEIETNVLTHENLPLFNAASKRQQQKLQVWHSQLQHGPAAKAAVLPNNAIKKCNGLRSQSLIECKRMLNSRGGSGAGTSSRHLKKLQHHHHRPEKRHSSFSHCGSASMLETTPCQNSFMSPTLSSEKKSLKQQVESVKLMMGSKFKGRAPSPRCVDKAKDIPFTNQHGRAGISRLQRGYARAVRSEELGHGNPTTGVVTGVYSTSTLFGGSSSSCDNGIFLMLHRVKSTDFNNALKGLAEIIDTARTCSPALMMPYMTLINQRLLELLKSPRSHVARTACQLSGHFFEVMRDTRRPEFDDIVNTLLYKTADASKFIRQDANMALDAMVTHIPTFHAVRSVCAKGPTHRNPLVRSAAVRLIICAVVIASPSHVMHHPNHEASRKRIIDNLTHFLADKNGETRKYAERLYKILHSEGTFEFYAKRYLNRTKFETLLAAIKSSNKNG